VVGLGPLEALPLRRRGQPWHLAKAWAARRLEGFGVMPRSDATAHVSGRRPGTTEPCAAGGTRQ
jgi:hypothetical protein